MNVTNWNSLKLEWKKQTKPAIDELAIRKEYQRQKMKAQFTYAMEGSIVLAIIGYTIWSFQTKQVDLLLLTDLWAVLTIIGIFVYRNRILFAKSELNSTRNYLQFLIRHAQRKQRTGLFVITLSIVHGFAIQLLSGLSVLTSHPFHIAFLAAFIIGYVSWGIWFYVKSKKEEHRLKKIFRNHY